MKVNLKIKDNLLNGVKELCEKNPETTTELASAAFHAGQKKGMIATGLTIIASVYAADVLLLIKEKLITKSK